MPWKKKYPQLLKQDRYTIIDQVGEGGMAVVFLCLDNELDEQVALKILKPDLVNNDKTIQQFKREIKIARKITHRNICRIYDFGKFEILYYIVMEYMEGTPLSSLIRKSDELVIDKKLEISLKILNGLEAAHCEKVIHRDLKPGNIMLIKNYEPIIMDFGLARHSEDEKITPDSRIFGTPAYMSPEQITGEKVDHRADIYSFGLILYELLTGKYPFDDTNYFKLLYSHVNDAPQSPRHFLPNLDIRLETIILKCLEKNVNNRYQNALEITKDILASIQQDDTKHSESYKKKILVVDDERLLRVMLTKMFESFNMEVFQASDGQEAITTAMAEKPDLICLDIMMPRMSGLEAAEILLSSPQTKEIPIVIFSCKDDNEYMVYSRELGIRDYLVKPVQLDDIKSRLSYWLLPNQEL